MDAKGQSGVVDFDGQFVTITRTGLARATVGKGDKRIPVPSISAIRWKPASALTNGFIEFTLAGGLDEVSMAGSQTDDASLDENSVVFTKKQQPPFEELRAAVEAALQTTTSQQRAQLRQPFLVGDEVDRLLRLRDAGGAHRGGVSSTPTRVHPAQTVRF